MKKKITTTILAILSLVILVKGFQYWSENIWVELISDNEKINFLCDKGGTISYSTYRDNFDQSYQKWKDMVLNVSPARRRGNIKMVKKCYREMQLELTNAQKQLNQMHSQGIPVDKIVEEIKEKDNPEFAINGMDQYFQKKYHISSRQFSFIYGEYIPSILALKYYERLFNDLHINPNQD